MLSGYASLDPCIDFVFLEFPETPDLVRGHGSFTNPFVDRVAFNAQVSAYFIDG